MARPLSVLAVITTTLAVAAVLLAPKAESAATSDYTRDMEEAAHSVVEEAIRKDKGDGAALVRLLFHDCWVKGCDGSVLLGERTNKDSANATGTEKNAFSNIGLGGFDVIDEIKKKLPDVSCADIVVFAAREATIILSKGKITYDVKAGRGDGVFSSARYADRFLPPPTFTFEELKANFAGKGFNQTELVVLSGAHAVGRAHYVSFNDRLNSSTSTPIDPSYQAELISRRDGGGGLLGGKPRRKKPHATEVNNIRDMDSGSQNRAGYNSTGVNTTELAIGDLDNSYYHANLQNRVLFTSDWELRNDTTRKAGMDMNTYKKNATVWYGAFGEAMAKLSNLPGVGTMIRKNCKKNN